MAGEPILVVDDTPVNLKLTRILLVNEGYKVLTAASAEEALELLRSFHPELVLADIQLPGIDGFELTRRLKSNEETREILVVALTAFAMKGDEQKAIDAGCDGYITKPIDTRTLGARIREILARRSTSALPPPAKSYTDPRDLIPAAEMRSLRQRFLNEGLDNTRQWLLDLDERFDPEAAARAVHQWIGAGGLLGYTAISRLSREVEAVLKERPVDAGQLRESLTSLALSFTNPREARDLPVPESIVESLKAKRVALVGFHALSAERLCVALERAQAVKLLLDPSQPSGAETLEGCDLVVVHSGSRAAADLAPGSPLAKKPLVLAGTRDELLALDAGVQALARECLVEPWEIDEALLRLSLALARPGKPAQDGAAAARPLRPNSQVRPKVLIADDDPTVLVLVRASIQNFGMDCQTTCDGREALDAIRRDRPSAAVLDVNMPGMDGYEVLETVRAENLPVRILLLTARQQEQDILRGFTLGADDYLVKPFNPMELVARLKRLLW
jgi:two-component system cell cycle response regulator DivK